MIYLDLPFPPSVNTYWRSNGNRRFISKKGVEFKQAVAEYVIDNKIPKLGTNRLEVSIWIYPNSKRLMDLDNRLKAILDALQDAGVYDDDEQIDVLLVQRGEILKGGKAKIFIEVLPK